MNLNMQKVDVECSLLPYLEELDSLDNYSGAEAVGYILGVGIVAGGVWGIIAGGVKIVSVVAAAT